MSAAMPFTQDQVNPLQSIEQWEDDVLVRYPEEGLSCKSKRSIPQLR